MGPDPMRTPSNLVIDAALGLATLAGRAWMLFPPKSGVSISRNLPYGPAGRHRLDVYTPTEPRGVHVLFIHGGSFRTCSKESHTYVGRTLAAAGIHVYAIDYGLAPEFPYPTAHEDGLLAWRWLTQGRAREGVVATAGDSAGANVALSIAVACLGGFGDVPAARDLRTPDAVLSLSGLLRVRGSAQAYQDNAIAHARLAQIETDFLGPLRDAPLAEPLDAIEAGGPWLDALPPVFIAVGDEDGIARDSHALDRALQGRKATLHTYPEQGHAFMISPFREASARCWADAVAFFDRFLGGGSDT